MTPRELFRNNPFVLVFVSLMLFLVLSTAMNTFFLGLLFSLTLLTGIYATFEGKPKLNFGLVVGVVAIVMTFSISLETKDVFQNVIRFIFFFSFVGYVCHRIMMKVIRSKDIDFNIISGAVSVYLLIALEFSFVFSLLHYFDEQSFRFPTDYENALDLVYFSYVTITTLGYGEITPVNPIARSLSIVLALVGQLYLTILVAILVSKFKGWKMLQREDPSQDEEESPPQG